MSHHKRWIEALEDQSKRRIIIISAPAAAKTSWLIAYCGWRIGQKPNIHLGYITYSDVVSFDRSTAIRDTTQTARYQMVFPDIVPDANRGWGQAQWFIKREDEKTMGDPHPTLRACGLGSSIIAFRFDELICDDLCSQGNTQTEYLRDQAWSWWEQTLMTRLAPNGRVIYIGTRWHEDDIPGRLLKQHGWEPIHIPALDDDDNSYWPEFWPIGELHKMKTEIGSDAFQCQYQGRPVAQEGNIFRWFLTYSQKPPMRAIVQFWDTAYSSKEEADYSACTTWGYGEDGLIYCLGAYQDRLDFPELCEAVKALYEQDKPTYIFAEQKASGTSVFQEIRRQTGLPIIPVTYRGNQDKMGRANSVVAYFENGKVRFPTTYSPWKKTLIDQLRAFPRGKYDDLVDSAVGAIMQIIQRVGRPELKPIPLEWD
jgi:predicted phage terminase large subunit-like protein